ncbi:MAG: hypothetical protein KDA24_19645, partial [Deltaproteobacteria bacterium]|nr:hypothetical protein [Deltaproteobacteria bacterium]
SPGLTRLNAFRGDAGLREHRPAPTNHPRVTHYIAHDDLVHRAGQRHLEGMTVMAVGLHLDRGGGIHPVIGHSDMLLGTHGLRARLEALKLDAHWTPHTHAIWGRLAEHPTTAGSLHEAVRASVALSLDLLQAWLARPDDPEALVRLVPNLARQALGEEDIGYPAIAQRVSRRVARDSWTASRRLVGFTLGRILRRGGGQDSGS